jgi:hypothetical protein
VQRVVGGDRLVGAPRVHEREDQPNRYRLLELRVAERRRVALGAAQRLERVEVGVAQPAHAERDRIASPDFLGPPARAVPALIGGARRGEVVVHRVGDASVSNQSERALPAPSGSSLPSARSAAGASPRRGGAARAPRARARRRRRARESAARARAARPLRAPPRARVELRAEQRGVVGVGAAGRARERGGVVAAPLCAALAHEQRGERRSGSSRPGPDQRVEQRDACGTSPVAISA